MESVLSQTYHDFEYIIVDGASTDGSVDIIREYANQLNITHSTIHLLWSSEPDNGVYQAMNKGIVRAEGEYCLFLNSGDFLVAPDVIDCVMNQCNGADILCARCNVSDKGKVVWTSNPPDQITFGTLYTIGLAHQSTFIKRTLFETCGLYREDFKYNSDIAFWYKAIIDHHATTQRIDVITTDYNLDGISSKENKTVQYIREHEEILVPYDKFIPDYVEWLKERKILSKYSWVERHACIRRILVLCYKILKHFNRL
jgi:glycosyltransferase involved in cell wall biosynthesis